MIDEWEAEIGGALAQAAKDARAVLGVVRGGPRILVHQAIAHAWFMGLNPQLNDRSPARLLREGEIDEVGPEIVSAARAFVIGG